MRNEVETVRKAVSYSMPSMKSNHVRDGSLGGVDAALIRSARISPDIRPLGPDDKLVIHTSANRDIRLTDADGNVMLTIYAGEKPLTLKHLGSDMAFEWRPADEAIASGQESVGPSERQA